MLTVATFALTIALYIFIPKGFLPRQDTGVLSVVAGGGSGRFL